MNAKALLIISVCVNLGLGFYAFRKSARPPVPTKSGKSVQTTNESPAVESDELRAVTNTVVKRFTWESVESADYKQYIANLRSVGCPEETIRDIIIADVNKLYDHMKKQARGEPRKFEYWKTGNPFGSFMEPEMLRKMQALDAEKNEVLRALGIEPDFKSQVASIANPLEPMLDFLPDDKKAVVLKVMSDMQTKMINRDNGPDAESVGKAMKEMESALKQVMTPEEYLNYELRFSLTATTMRGQLSGFDPNEEEFLKVFKLRREFDDEFNPMLRGNETESQMQARREAEEKLSAQIKQTLGADRYADYEMSRDWTFQQIQASARRADLGTAEARQIYQMKSAAENETARVRSQSNLSPEQQAAALSAIRQETEQSIQNILGEKGWDHYNRPGNTYWLRRINPEPR